METIKEQVKKEVEVSKSLERTNQQNRTTTIHLRFISIRQLKQEVINEYKKIKKIEQQVIIDHLIYKDLASKKYLKCILLMTLLH